MKIPMRVPITISAMEVPGRVCFEEVGTFVDVEIGKLAAAGDIDASRGKLSMGLNEIEVFKAY